MPSSTSAGTVVTPSPKRDKSNCLRLVCRYHAWSYNLDGTLANAPDAAGEAGFCKDELGLTPVAIEQWGPALFVNLDVEASPVREFLGQRLYQKRG